MGWVKLDDTFSENPKVEQAGDLAAWLYICGLQYCSRNKTEGFIPDGRVSRLTGLRNNRQLARKLIKAGMWEKVPHGVQVTDWAKFQYTATQDRYQRMVAAPGSFTPEQVRARVEFYGGKCWICRQVEFQALDHVKPLARGGSNWPSNLRPVCKPCNSRKGARWPL